MRVSSCKFYLRKQLYLIGLEEYQPFGVETLLPDFVQVVELLIRKLESEPSYHRKVDLFFLVDSITQCSHNQKGIKFNGSDSHAVVNLRLRCVCTHGFHVCIQADV